MEERLENLRATLDESLLKELTFSNKHRMNIKNRINGNKNPKIDILQLLQVKRTGYDLSRSLFARGVYQYQFDEGSLYLLLHELEISQYIIGEWTNEEKYYVLTNKGFKYLQKLENKTSLPIYHRPSFEGDC